ncbi:putative ribonuclease H-like domain-containing protein [Tanacetum coccineum]|uniref:Ribonuclease H-like domain-containing protein n=1 Tax=Tanacetum coccineum TaxID=301880 RepID=A0ABQ4YBD6_9ASTR
MTHSHPNRRFVPQAILTRSGKINTAGASVNTASVSVNTAVRPVNTAGSKPTVNHPRPISNSYKKGYSQVIRPFKKYSEYKNSIFNKKVNTVRVKDNTARDREVVSENKGIRANAVKASACWQKKYKEKGVIDSGCSRHMTGNKFYLTEYEDYDGGFVSFRDGKGRISRKGKIKTGTLDFENVYFCKELKYNLFSVSNICDKKNNVLFTDTECLVLSFDFKLLDESQVLMRVPRKDNIYSVDLKSVVPTKGKQHKASCKDKLVNSISKPLHMLHMDLFGPTNVTSLMKKSYCLVVTNDFSRFSWVFLLATKDETSGILKTFITEIENQLDHKVKVIRCDNRTELKNSVMNQFCEIKGIKREFNVVRTPQQNGVAERRNRTLIEAARTMVLIIKPHNKSPYELIHGRTPLIAFIKPFGCPITILNTKDHLGKFDGKADEGFFLLGQAEKKTEPEQEYILIPFCTTDSLISQGPKDSKEDSGMKPTEVDVSGASDKDGEDDQATRKPMVITINKAKENKLQRLLKSAYLPKVWTLVNLPNGKRAIGTQWVFRNKKDERGIVVRNKARLVAQGYTQEEGIDYDEMDVKSAFLYGTIDEEVYVDDIIFGSTKKSLCDEFEGLMHKRFQMSSMGELTFFLGLQVQQKKDGIFINQDKYVADILKKFDFATIKTASTPMEPTKALIKDEEADSVDVHLYRSMIGSLLYLTASRPDIMFAVYAYARFQVTPKMSHLHAVKRIFRYLKGQPKLGLWYPGDSPFDLEAFSNNKDEGSGQLTDPQPTSTFTQLYNKETNLCSIIISTQKTHKPRKAIRTTEISQSSGPINLVAYETVYKEWEDRMERAATTASSLDAEQDSGNINRTQSMATLNESFPQGTDSGSGPRCQDTILGV